MAPSEPRSPFFDSDSHFKEPRLTHRSCRDLFLSFPFLPFVRHLKLQCQGRPLDTVHLSRLHRCPNLTALSIEIRHSNGEISFTSGPNSKEYLLIHLRSWNANALSLLRFDLEYNEMECLSISTIVNLLSCVPSVEAVVIDILYGIGKNTVDTYPSYVPTRLANLDVHLSMGDLEICSPIFDWLLSIPEPLILKSLKYDGGFRSDPTARSLETFIHRVGGELECLTLHFFGVQAGRVPAFFLLILPHTKIPKLRALSFICYETSEILAILPLLRHESNQDSLWHKVDGVLLEFCNLQRFVVSSNTCPAMTLLRMKALLQLADAHGIIKEPSHDGIQIALGMNPDFDH
ncbi:hypothetical protein B0H19DRAFT_1263362 [Mycena capillaripes]|nr:hypothetical protein B0H19DRAFT_1263362 [Mycena capillaripes]